MIARFLISMIPVGHSENRASYDIMQSYNQTNDLGYFELNFFFIIIIIIIISGRDGDSII